MSGRASKLCLARGAGCSERPPAPPVRAEEFVAGSKVGCAAGSVGWELRVHRREQRGARPLQLAHAAAQPQLRGRLDRQLRSELLRELFCYRGRDRAGSAVSRGHQAVGTGRASRGAHVRVLPAGPSVVREARPAIIPTGVPDL